MHGSHNRQRGASTVLWILSLVPLLGLAALAVDVNNLFVASSELQNAADAGALEGTRHLYDDTGTTLQRATAIAQGTAAASANLARQSAAEVASVEIGHWRFDPDGGGQFTPSSAAAPLEELWNKVLYDPSDPSSCNNLNNACSGEINAVRVTTERRTTPIQSFFGRVLGYQSYQSRASAVAYVGYAGTIGPAEVDQPIAICQEAITNPDGNAIDCSVGRFMPSSDVGGETGGWTSLDQENACAGGTNASELRPLICASGNPKEIMFGRPIATVGGQVQSAFSDLFGCWEATTNRTEPWPMVLPVIKCDGTNPGPCNKVIGTVAVNVLYIVDQANKIQDDAPMQMIEPGDADGDGEIGTGDGVWNAPEQQAGESAEEYGIRRWDDFVDHFNLMGLDTDGDGYPDPAYWNDNPQLNGWRQKTIYFAPACTVEEPSGLTGGRNFGIRAEVPVLVD